MNERNDTAGHGAEPILRPRIDLYETDEAFLLLADLPGADEGSTELALERQTLTLRARTRSEVPEGARPLRTEFALGTFERQFELGPQIDGARITAALQDGVLRATLPKASPARHPIPIRTS